MTITFFGILVLLIGSVLMFRASSPTMLIFVMLTTLMGGSAAFILSTGSSILPALEAVLLLAMRLMLPTYRPMAAVRTALDANLPLILFAVYGMAGGVILPFIFSGAIEVAPLRPIFTPDPFAKQPLTFTSQNLTAAGYLFTTMLGAVCAFAAVQTPGTEARIARVAAVIAIVHASLGFIGITVAGTPFAAILNFFRNALYNQLDQEIGGLSRMNGIFAEASNYAGYGFIYFVFVAELWLRDVDRRWTGPAAMMLLSALLVSTSTTGYIGLAAYALLLSARQLLFPNTIPGSKLLIVAAGLLGVVAVMLATFVIRPESFRVVEIVFRSMIVNKAESESGLVRMMWARQGLEAFRVSGGLGIGVGSFRSSSLGTAILGSMGVIGVITYAAQMLRVIKPLRQSTYVRTGDLRIDVGVSAAWAVMALSVPAFVSTPSADPGLNWGLMTGIALGLRKRADRPRPAAEIRAKV